MTDHPAAATAQDPLPLHRLATRAGAALESLRPYQWLKNALVFLPLAAAHRLTDTALRGAALRTFIAFSLCAASVYLLNDLWDAEADRRHPHKRNRPIASGRLPRSWAVTMVPILLLAGALTALPVGWKVAATLGAYFLTMILYSLHLKAVVLLDTMALAGGYSARVVAGALAVGIWPSPWLFAFCTFLFFSLAVLKRYAELTVLRTHDGPGTHARAYLLEDQEYLLVLGIGCGIASVLVLALYASSVALGGVAHRNNPFAWFTCVLLLYWVSHMWLAGHRGRMTDDPLVFALRNRVSQVLIALMGVTVWLAA